MSDYPYESYEPIEGQEMQYSSPYQMEQYPVMHHNPPPIHSNPNLRRQDVMPTGPISPSPANPFYAIESQREYKEYQKLIDGIVGLQKGMSERSVDRVPAERIIIPASMLTPKQLLDLNEEEVMEMKKKYLAQLQNIPHRIVEEVEKAKREKNESSNVVHTIECYKKLREWAQSWIDRLISESPDGHYYWNAVAIKNFHDHYSG